MNGKGCKKAAQQASAKVGGGRPAWVLLALVLAGCAVPPAAVREPVPLVARVDETMPGTLLAYHQQLLRLSSQEQIGRAHV